MEKLHVLYTSEEIEALIAQLENPDHEYVAYDTETTGLSLDALIVGYSVAWDPEEAFYVVTKFWDAEAKELVDMGNQEATTRLLKVLQTKSLVMHHAFVDCNWTERNYGIQLKESVHTDTMELAHVLDENRMVGLKELGYAEFGADAKKEQSEMQASVEANGGIWEKKRGGNKEMYKADPEIMGRYGAKDTILTLKLFFLYVPQLFEQGLDDFFYRDESMPLLRGPTYDMNVTGLKVDMEKIKALQLDLTREIGELHAAVLADIQPYIKDFYLGTNKKNTFNIGSSQQMSWLLFVRLGNDWKKLTDAGRDLAKALTGKTPYNPSQRRQFAQAVKDAVDAKDKPLKLHKYLKCDKNVLLNFSFKYKWVANLLKHNQLTKLLSTYAIGIQEKVEYGIIHPSFLQHGTTSGRYSSRKPNFQNLPRDDKRIKKCIVARPGKTFVGADQAQLEPRVFASYSKDERLLNCFKNGDDFYSVVGIPVFHKFDCVPKKDKHPKAFGILFPIQRQISKAVALAATYGTTAYKMTDMLRGDDGRNLSVEECEQIIEDYFTAYPSVKAFQRACHKEAIDNGVVYNLFGRPRRIPKAKWIANLGRPDPKDLPYEFRTLLNLAVNHKIQSTSASIMNRGAIAFYRKMQELGIDVKIVMQIHDELVAECWIEDAPIVTKWLKHCMETAVQLPGVDFIAEPKTAPNLAELK